MKGKGSSFFDLFVLLKSTVSQRKEAFTKSLSKNSLANSSLLLFARPGLLLKL